MFGGTIEGDPMGWGGALLPFSGTHSPVQSKSNVQMYSNTIINKIGISIHSPSVLL